MLTICAIGRFIGNCQSLRAHRSSVNSIIAFVTAQPRASSCLAIASATLPDCFVTVWYTISTLGFVSTLAPSPSDPRSRRLARSRIDRRRPVAGQLARRGGEALGVDLLDEEIEHRLLQRARAVVGVAGVREVAFFERVESEVVELVLVGLGVGHSIGVAATQALVALARPSPELSVVVVAGELDEVPLAVAVAVAVDVGYHGLQVVGLLDLRVPIQTAGEPLERASRPLGTLADLVIGGEQDRLRRR